MSRTLRANNGDGILFFPSEESRNEAASNLQNVCTIETQDRNYKSLYPKLKISGISKDSMDKIDKTTLRQEILTKNATIRYLVMDKNKI